MFKFESKIKDLHRFTSQINDVHKFSKRINDVHTFTVKCLNAFIIKRTSFEDKTKSYVFIGGRKTQLSEFNTKLKDLPITLRQFVGAYVYVKVKARFLNVTKSTTQILGKLKIKGRINDSTKAISTISAKLRIKGVFQPNNVISVVEAKFLRRIKGKFSSTTSHTTENISSKLRAKVKLNDYNITFDMLQDKLIAKAKIVNTTKSTTSASYYQGKSKKLITYDNVALSDLPVTLKKLCFNFTSENWEDVRASYDSWEDVKINVSTWNDLMK